MIDLQTFWDLLGSSEGEGYCDSLSKTSIQGWAYNKANPADPLLMEVIIDGNYVSSVRCNLIREDLGENLPAHRFGFYVAIPKDMQDNDEHVVEFRHSDGRPIILRDASGVHHRWVLPKSEVPILDVMASPPKAVSTILGVLDPVQERKACGWAYNIDNPDVPIVLHSYIDGEFQQLISCDIERQDVLNAGHPTSKLGFEFEIPARYLDDEPHVLEVRPPDRSLQRFETSQGQGAARQSFRLSGHVVVGQVDGLRYGAVRGWVFRKSLFSNTTNGRLQVLVTMQGNPIAQISARGLRADVAAAYDCDPNCGFAFYPPARFVAGKSVEFDFRVIPGGHPLVGSPMRVSFPSLETLASLRELRETADKIFTDLWLLRDRLRRMTPGETYTVEYYDPWARQYQQALADAPDQLSSLIHNNYPPPLVSIICPVFKPRLQDFSAAVESVLAQTYTNWELIIVDDASGSEDLTRCITQYAQLDKRIKQIHLTSNSGISGATNAAMAQAQGDYVALFDHDDLLAVRAMELMIAAALRSGAQLLYSDEDKIDDDGTFSEVNLKPDWNYRLLLSINYVCHLLIVERTQLTRAGPFRSEYDGAQDHDMVLRLSEIIPYDKIHHVPEILYHWRKTPASTAASGKSKAYAVSAGERAIQDHLNRKGLAGRVYAPREITCYAIEWNFLHQPEVTIIIPYREHVDMTRACVEAIFSNTSYNNYSILLIDNWSTSDEALAFAEEMNTKVGINVMRIEEAFNYSRLNNLAVRESRSELLLFLNNDVFVSDPNWLRAMIGEMQADPRVGIVGSKLLYPNGLVQHGGVILGVGGVADHAHKGLDKDDPGYVARAICAQELSAVTAACMLCRRDVFDSVGGFDEQDLQVAFNDVDLCLKIREAGFRIIWTPSSVAEHRESLSRGDDMRPDQQARFFQENEVMLDRWRKVLSSDRFYHRVFSRLSGVFVDLDAPNIEEVTI